MDQVWLYASDDDGENFGDAHGPLTWEQLKTLALTGEIDPESWVWRGGDSPRKPAWTVDQLLAACAAGKTLREEDSYITIQDDAGEEVADSDSELRDSARDIENQDLDEDVSSEPPPPPPTGARSFENREPDEDEEPIRWGLDLSHGGAGFSFEPNDDHLARIGAAAPVIQPRSVLLGHEGGVSCLAFRPEGRLLASGGFDHEVQLCDITSGATLNRLTGHEDTIAVVAFSPTDPVLASASWDGTIRLWELDGGAPRLVIRAHEGPVNALAISADGPALVSGGDDGTIRWWNMTTGREFQRIRTPSSIQSLCLIPDGSIIISTHKPRYVCLWDFESGEEVHPDLHRQRKVERCHIVSCSPDGTRFAVAGNTGRSGGVVDFGCIEIIWQGYVSLWDLATLTERRFPAHSGFGFSVAFSPDGRMLASAGGEGVAKLWDASTGNLLGVLEGHRSAVHDVAFSPDGRLAATAGEDSAIHLYDVVALTGRGRRQTGLA